MPCLDIERIVALAAWPLAEEEGARRLAARAGRRCRDRPGMTGSPGVRTLFYGRSAALSPPA